ncbi:hypothetical protein LV78_007942 [Actinosynnema pretiosum]|nr:hypothetical protein [Actinosynnema pretiosum]
MDHCTLLPPGLPAAYVPVRPGLDREEGGGRSARCGAVPVSGPVQVCGARCAAPVR